MKGPFAPAEDEFLVRHYQTMHQKDMAAHLNRHPHSIQRRMGQLRREGRADICRSAYNPRWSLEELRFAKENLGREGWSYERMAAHLGRTENALKLALLRRGTRKPILRHLNGTLSLRDLMQVMGLSGNHGAARRWLTSGLLKAKRLPKSHMPAWIIYPHDLAEFIRRHPEAYERDRVPRLWRGKANPFRTYLPPAKDPTAGYLCSKHAARVLGIAHHSVTQCVRKGRLPGVRLRVPGVHPNDWWIPKAAVEAYRRQIQDESPRARVMRALEARGLFPPPSVVPNAVKEEIAAEIGRKWCAVDRFLTIFRREQRAERKAA